MSKEQKYKGVDYEKLEGELVTEETATFFFYGIFLDEDTRHHYGIYSEPKYATIRDYVTYGSHIATAHKQEGAGLVLTGIIVDVPLSSIPAIDRLEGGYDRTQVTTVQGRGTYLYVARDYEAEAEREKRKEEAIA